MTHGGRECELAGCFYDYYNDGCRSIVSTHKAYHLQGTIGYFKHTYYIRKECAEEMMLRLFRHQALGINDVNDEG